MRRLLTFFALMIWGSACGFGIWKAERYANTPGKSATGEAQWPAGSALTREPKRATLVMFVHPQCPCSRASIGELSQIMAHSGGRLQAYVLFVRPDGIAPGWEQTDLWRSAAVLPDVKVLVDPSGRQARQFQAATSGQTFLYDAEGRLLFRGGITSARGHLGDNAGQEAILSLLEKGQTHSPTTPVFGCQLF
jgi:hypothetical protein